MHHYFMCHLERISFSNWTIIQFFLITLNSLILYLLKSSFRFETDLYRILLLCTYQKQTVREINWLLSKKIWNCRHSSSGKYLLELILKFCRTVYFSSFWCIITVLVRNDSVIKGGVEDLQWQCGQRSSAVRMLRPCLSQRHHHPAGCNCVKPWIRRRLTVEVLACEQISAVEHLTFCAMLYKRGACV